MTTTRLFHPKTSWPPRSAKRASELSVVVSTPGTAISAFWNSLEALQIIHILLGGHFHHCDKNIPHYCMACCCDPYTLSLLDQFYDHACTRERLSSTGWPLNWENGFLKHSYEAFRGN